MSNEEYLKYLQNYNDNAKLFQIQNNILILNYNGTFKMPITHINLSELNPNIFNIDPRETFQIIYVLELLYKPNLTESETNFITNYTQKYLSLNDSVLENDNDDKDRVWCLSIPIYKAYDPMLIETPAAITISNVINNHSEIIESGKGKQKRLVLENKNIPTIIDEEDNLPINMEKAGFISLLFIVAAVIATISYITYYIIS